MSAMAPQDAMIYWLSKRTRNDQFLLYCFTDGGRPTEELRASVAERSARIVDLRVRLRELPADLDYPSWVPCAFTAEQFVEHRLAKPDWSHLLDVLGDVLGTGMDAAVRPWRLHVFRGIVDAPGAGKGPALVAVLQMSHALADGRRASAIARALFTEPQVADGCDRRPVPGGDGIAEAVAHDSRGCVGAERVVVGGSGGAAGADGVDPTVVDDRPEPGAAGRCGVVPTQAMSPLFAQGRQVGSVAVAGALVIGSAVSARRQAIGRSTCRTGALIDSALGLLCLPVRLASTSVRGYQAFQAQRRLAHLTDTGRLPPPGPEFAPSAVNRTTAHGVERHQARMIVRSAESMRIPGRTVTVVMLTAVSLALGRYLTHRGEPALRLGAQVPMALPELSIGREGDPRNNYRSLGVDLFVDEPDLRRRADKIAAALTARRLRARHPLLSAQDRVTATVPAPLLRRDIDRYPLDTVPDSIAGHTVVSSVHRGPADLTFGDGRVRFSAGFPALGSVMHLTHGVHGLGDTVTISVHSDPAVLADVDFYTALLASALDEVAAAH
ncbi:wax ester/triacylglycerol synthase domain-containing protein [Nocardia sp. NPDC049220]|uniref:wax ester/triacylglycerol synthase domain-containing protein n=1 Tax=Nocardia sp. NPDC049220 TaxID=3155273 RepID=UPI0033FD511E